MSTTQEDEWFETLESFRFYYPRYLQSKTSVDKKAFHKETWNHFSTLLGSFSKEEIRLIDVGAGIGSMFLHVSLFT